MYRVQSEVCRVQSIVHHVQSREICHEKSIADRKETSYNINSEEEVYMETKKPVPGSFYRHFKGNVYQIRELAKNTETEEDMVVYQAMYPPFQIWVRPLSMFLDVVDHEKYPEYDQKYRFQEIRLSADQPDEQSLNAFSQKRDDSPAQQNIKNENITDQEFLEILINGRAEKYLMGKMSDEEIARRGFLAILDAETYRKKRQIFVGLRDYLNELYLNNLAAALDIVLEEGSFQEHYDTLLYYLETNEKYEGGRLRG